MAPGALVVATMGLLIPSDARAQFSVGASFGFVRFQGGSEPVNPADTVFLEPYGPLDYRLRGSYRTGDWQLSLAASYAKPGLGTGIDFFLLVDRSALKVVTIEPTVGRRVLGPKDGPSQFWLEAGPSVGLWSLFGETRTQVGGVVAATLRQRLVGKFETVLRGDVSVSPSFFRNSDGVNSVLRFTNVSRYGFSIGFDYRL